MMELLNNEYNTFTLSDIQYTLLPLDTMLINENTVKKLKIVFYYFV